jgi:hypothetical protein
MAPKRVINWLPERSSPRAKAGFRLPGARSLIASDSL